MTRFDLYKLSPWEQKELLDRFFTAVTSLGSYKEVKDFFKDLLHPQEITMLARRLKIAEMLLDGETYEEINRKMKAGYSTITKVHRWVNSGAGGYKIVAKRLDKIDKRQLHKDIKGAKAREYGWEQFKKVYPTFDFDNVDEIIEAIKDYARRKKRKKSLKKK